MHLLLLVPNHYDIQQIERVSLNDDPSRNWIFHGLKPSRGGCQYRWLWVTSIDILSLLLVETFQMMYLSLWVVCVCVIIAGGWIASKKILWINVWTCFNPTFLDVDQIPMILPNRRFIFYSPFLLILKLPNQSGKFRYCIWQLDTPIVLWLLDFHDMHDPVDHVNLYLGIKLSAVCIN